jgi:hypothetical protein
VRNYNWDTPANGTTQITSGLISQLASAPFFPTLPQVPYQVQQGTYVYAGQDTGAANAYVITFPPSVDDEQQRHRGASSRSKNRFSASAHRSATSFRSETNCRAI